MGARSVRPPGMAADGDALPVPQAAATLDDGVEPFAPLPLEEELAEPVVVVAAAWAFLALLGAEVAAGGASADLGGSDLGGSDLAGSDVPLPLPSPSARTVATTSPAETVPPFLT